MHLYKKGLSTVLFTGSLEMIFIARDCDMILLNKAAILGSSMSSLSSSFAYPVKTLLFPAKVVDTYSPSSVFFVYLSWLIESKTNNLPGPKSFKGRKAFVIEIHLYTYKVLLA